MIRTLLLASAIAATLGLGTTIDDNSADFDAATAIEDAQLQAQATARYEAAVQKLCGTNAGWMQLENDVVQCYTKRGAKTITATLRRTP